MILNIVCQRWDKAGGGCEQYLFDLASHANKLGIAVNVHAMQVITPKESIYGIRVFKSNGTGNIGRNLLALLPVEGATHYQIHTGLYADCFRGEKASMPSFFRRLFYPLGQSLNIKRQRLLRHQDQWLQSPQRPSLMVFSHFTARELKHRYGIDPATIHINPHGVDLKRFSPLKGKNYLENAKNFSGSEKKPCFLFVAHNFQLKGLRPLFQAISSLHKKGTDVFLNIAGSGPVGSFDRLARSLGIRSQVNFMGCVTRNDLPNLYRNSTALVHPTFYDPCSLVVLEALACGCPVVTTRNNGAAELIRSGIEGLILDDPRNVEAISDSLQTLQDPHRSEEMGRAASELARYLDIRRHMAETMKWLGLSSE